MQIKLCIMVILYLFYINTDCVCTITNIIIDQQSDSKLEDGYYDYTDLSMSLWLSLQ